MKGCFAAWIALLALAAWGQDGAPAFRATSELVLLDVQVIHNKTNTAMGLVYAASARVIDGFTRDHARTAAAVAQAAALKSDDAAFFNEAVCRAAAQLENSANPSSGRVILWFTDNLPNLPTRFLLRNHDKGLAGAPPHTEEDAIRKLHESGTDAAVVEGPVVLLGRPDTRPQRGGFARENPDGKNYSPGDAHKYAELTGGFAVEPKNAS